MSTRDKLCLDRYESNQECYAYFNWIFNDIRYYFNRYNANNFNDKIDAIDNSILRHIAIHLIANYHEAKKYFSNDGKWKDNPACDLLNKWLDNRKSYFTHALHCKGNVQLWDKTIEPLWKKLEEEFKKKSNSNEKWCERNNNFRGYLELPKELKPPICYKHVPKKYTCVLPFPPNMCNLKNTCKVVEKYYKKCKSNGDAGNISYLRSKFAEPIANGNSPFEGTQDVTFSRQVQNHCCPSLEYAVPISFTPFGSKLSYRSINKKRLRDNFNEELEYEEYARSMNNNSHSARRKNHIYNHSVRY